MTSAAQRLRELGAHNDVVQWAEAFGDDALALFQKCPRGDWLLGIAARLGAPRQPLVAAAVACGREAITYLSEENPPLTAALETAAAWARGQASAEECAVQARIAESVVTQADAVTDAVVQAVVATLTAINEPAASAHAAACAAHAALVAAGDCAMESALRFTHERCANLVREQLSPEALAALLRAG